MARWLVKVTLKVAEPGAGGGSQPPTLRPTSLPKAGTWVPCLGLHPLGPQLRFRCTVLSSVHAAPASKALLPGGKTSRSRWMGGGGGLEFQAEPRTASPSSLALGGVGGPSKLGSKASHGASLVAQWLRVCLPMQGTRVRALVWEDPTCRGVTRPVSHNY